MNWFCLKACTKCGGDLAVDDGDWLCLQCGTYYYTGLYQRGWVSTTPQSTLGLGDTERQGDVRWPQVSGPRKGLGEEAGRLLGVS